PYFFLEFHKGAVSCRTWTVRHSFSQGLYFTSLIEQGWGAGHRWWRHGYASGPIGVLVTMPLWWLLVLAAAPTVRLWWLDRRDQTSGLCPHCGYDLRGLAEGAVCPECGAQGGARAGGVG